jgi:hypothetical protein
VRGISAHSASKKEFLTVVDGYDSIADIADFAQECSLWVGLKRHARGSSQIDEIESSPYWFISLGRIPNAYSLASTSRNGEFALLLEAWNGSRINS